MQKKQREGQFQRGEGRFCFNSTFFLLQLPIYRTANQFIVVFGQFTRCTTRFKKITNNKRYQSENFKNHLFGSRFYGEDMTFLFKTFYPKLDEQV